MPWNPFVEAEGPLFCWMCYVVPAVPGRLGTPVPVWPDVWLFTWFIPTLGEGLNYFIGYLFAIPTPPPEIGLVWTGY